MSAVTRRCLIRALSCALGLAAAPGRAFGAARHAFRVGGLPVPPWNLDTPGTRARYGVGTIIAQRAFDEAGLPVRMEILPIARLFAETYGGQRDFLWGVVNAPERESFLAYSRPLWISPTRVFRRSSDRDALRPWMNWGDMSGRTLGVLRGVNYGIDLSAIRHNPTINVEIIASAEAFIPMLMSRRIDAFILNWESCRYRIRADGIDPTEILTCDIPIPDVPYCIAASRRSETAMAALPQVDAAIANLCNNGTITDLLRRGLDLQPPPGGQPSRCA